MSAGAGARGTPAGDPVPSPPTPGTTDADAPLDVAPGPGAGVDVLDVGRLEAALARRPGLARRLFTADELAACAGTHRPARHLAGRFCVKEAVTKALALPALRPLEIELLGRGGPPRLRLHGAAAARARALGGVVRVSLSHERDTATAIAVLTAPAGAPA